MFSKDLPTVSRLSSSLLTRLRACLTVLVGSHAKDDWEPLYADDPRFGDDEYEVVFATTRSVN